MSEVTEPEDLRAGRVSFVRDIGGTALLTALSTVSTFGVIALLARGLEESLFLEFNVVNRYLGFLAIAGNLGMAFAFIRYSDEHNESKSKAVANLCRKYLSRSAAVLLIIWIGGILAWSFIGHPSSILPLMLTFAWVMSQSNYHLSAPYTRRLNGFNGYFNLFLWAKIIAPVIGGVLAAISGRYELYFFVFAAISLGFQFVLWRENNEPAASLQDSPVLVFSRSRWIENMIRSALPVAFVFSAQLSGGAAFAGSVALIFTIAKSVESLVQPMVIAVMMRAGGSSRKKHSGLLLSFVTAVLLSAIIFISKGPFYSLVTLFLGVKFEYLQQEAWIVLMSAGPIIALSLLRALNDNKFSHSPLLAINGFCILSVPLVFLFADSLFSVSIAIAAIQIVRYLLYCLAIKNTLK